MYSVEWRSWKKTQLYRLKFFASKGGYIDKLICGIPTAWRFRIEVPKNIFQKMTIPLWNETSVKGRTQCYAALVHLILIFVCLRYSKYIHPDVMCFTCAIAFQQRLFNIEMYRSVALPDWQTTQYKQTIKKAKGSRG